MVYKKILIFLVFLFIFPINSFAKEKPQVVFINQIRGEECCSTGSLENLQKQVEAFEKYRIPSFFALRYDALTNQDYVDYLKQEISRYPDVIKLGLLIEITPQLAHDTGIQYHDIVERWFEAQNVFTIGYQKEDRKKIIDQLLKTFKNKFGYYPILTSAWMIDTESLNYLHKNYGVIAHQITREQWGVDSYTLYGGPPHYPYPGSKNWSFIPDFTEKNPILILRQTITDPLYNYGETKKSYTSQPNDYLNAGLDFQYFKNLIDQALFEQKTTGFALLGLENANEEKYQDEYLKQIDYISQLKDRVSLPNLEQLSNFWQKQKTTYYQGKDLIRHSDNKAEFITTTDRRVRQRQTNGKTYITDFRYFHPDLTDPYNDYVAKKKGYWIVPYAFDFSNIYKPESVFPETKNDLIINKQPEFKIKKFNPKQFNKTRMENYPYFLPEAIERDIDRNKSQFKVTIGKTIDIELYARDEYGYPANIYYPIEVKTDPEIEGIQHEPDSAKHVFIIPNNKFDFQEIILVSNQKIIKKIILFPRFLPFLKIIW
ncbi:MAG: hypothetical protein V1803_01965 [Candidatus Roizmanbacteria bacterium]